MAGRLDGKTALVTGSTKGIGLEIARAFVREGARVIVHSRSAEDCAREARALGPAAHGIPADLTRAEEVRWLAHESAERFGAAPDVLVNNAGQPRVAPSESLAEADYRQTLELNLTAYFILSQEVGRAMLARGSGTIVNVSSMFGSVAAPKRLAYCVSKAAVDMMTKVLAIEWAGRGVRVNAVSPGYVETEFTRGVAARGQIDFGELARRTPMGRLGTVEDIAEAAIFLAGPGASFITGQVLTVDGGWSSYGYL